MVNAPLVFDACFQANKQAAMSDEATESLSMMDDDEIADMAKAAHKVSGRELKECNRKRRQQGQLAYSGLTRWKTKAVTSFVPL